MKTLIALAGLSLATVATPALAATQIFYSDFENLPNAPAQNNFTTVTSADGWTGQPNIELQDNVAGSPAANGGRVFVELDTSGNSAMSRTFTSSGTVELSFLYSPRPNVSAASNGIEVLLNGVLLNGVTGDGGANTDWQTVTYRFNGAGTNTLTFRAAGISDSLGGYVDNIGLSAVPEPATWALMILGFGAIGGAMRRKTKASVRFA